MTPASATAGADARAPGPGALAGGVRLALPGAGTYLRLFWLLVLVEFGVPFLDFPYYIYDVYIPVGKLCSIGMFGVCLAYHVKGPLVLPGVSLLFLVFGAWSLVYGLVVRGVNDPFVSHLYAMVMPVAAISAGAGFARRYGPDERRFLRRVLLAGVWMSIVSVAAYLYLHHVTGSIAYFGFGSHLGFLVAYLLADRRFATYLLGLVAVVLSGKRSTTIVYVLATAAYAAPVSIRRLARVPRLRTVALATLLAVAGAFAAQYLYQINYFRRFETTLRFDLRDERSMFQATSGRWHEVVGIGKALNEQPIYWVLGKGMGAEYTVEPLATREIEVRHYSHFSPFGYLLVFGGVFTALLYGGLLRTLVAKRRYRRRFFYLGWLSLFAASFFGAILFTDPKVWFLYGAVHSMVDVGDAPPAEPPGADIGYSA